MQDAKEEVRARLNIEDVIGEYVQLKRAGRNFKGLSPFSGEKTPSFFVSPDKNIWHDFSSNKGGDLFSFVMEVEGMDFRSALEHLARKAGVELAQYETEGAKKIAYQKKRAIEANTMAANYYQHSLLRNQHALEYVFKKRALSRDIVEEFRIGYAPDSGNALVGYLSKKGFSKKEISDAGLANRYGGDMFRGRMSVPLMDPSGQVIGFTGRIIQDIENAPKYLNTPQTAVYDKGRHIFGLSQAKEAIRKHDYVVVVEGNLDVVSSHQAGVKQVVATAGTAMTEHHLRALKRLTGDVRLAFDGDKAGVAATERAIAIASVVGVELTIISLPGDAKDPDELIQQDIKLWKNAIDASEPAVEWVLDQYKKRVDMASASGKRSFTSAGLKLVRMIDDPVEREHYENIIATMTGTTLEAVHEKLTRSPEQEKPALKQVKASQPALPEKDYSYQDSVLAVAAVDVPSQELFAHMDISQLHGEERQAVARYFAANHTALLKDTPQELQKYDTYVKILLLQAETKYAEWDSNDRYFETARLMRQIEQEYKKQTRDNLTIELREAEASGDDAKADELRRALNTLIKEIARGKR
jgi:DNA primase